MVYVSSNSLSGSTISVGNDYIWYDVFVGVNEYVLFIVIIKCFEYS
ncbi:hypothetical protein ALNOE001_20060 [Candidatus Methanobinarius endosymbioticus]|uniref:Uncharacterized protein n=1 Tax=Candidatus Methanobinarius endosymbioticus TaxID=2006182 RepID=A0A366M7V1_9EURY|nr:hypothetical protein ALNOE001_20060 [Candidatus Methanobinarius endosymbioticus]